MAHPAPPRVIATDATLSLLQQLQERYGKLLFFQSGGCCDGSTPMCYGQGDFLLSDADVYLGQVGEVPFYISPEQFSYWRNCQLIIDTAPGRGGMFSLESGTGQRFLSRSRLFDDSELEQLQIAGMPIRPPAAA